MIGERVERVTFFGNLKGIRLSQLNTFVRAASNLCGGAFPDRENGIADEEVLKQTQRLLTEAGIPNAHPVILCNSAEERAEKIMQECILQSQNGAKRYWIIENDPISLNRAFASMLKNNGLPQEEFLSATTVINLSLGKAYDYIDSGTGLRIASLSPLFGSYPVHPDPAQGYLSA